MSVKAKVVVVDDHPLFRERLCQLINNEPALEVAGEAETAQEALEMIRETRPDMAIVDDFAALRARLDELIGNIERRVKVLDGLHAPPGIILNAVFCVAGFNIAYQQRNDLVLNRRYALGEIARSEYLQNRDDILATQRRASAASAGSRQ